TSVRAFAQEKEMNSPPITHQNAPSLPPQTDVGQVFKTGGSSQGKYVVQLEWQSVNGAKSYVLQISTDTRFTQLIYETGMTETAIHWATDVPGFYYWRVAAIDAEGVHG